MKRSFNLGLVLLILFLFGAATFRQMSVSAPDIQTDHAFNTAQAFSRLERLLGDETPHSVDSVANDVVRQRLIEEITGLGFDPIIRDDFTCKPYPNASICARVQNVMFWLNAPGPDAVMIASHYDSVPAGPGASDDGIGVAASLEIASILKGKTLTKPVLVLITDGEEAGLIGAHSFAKTDPFAALIGSVVNMEARGVRGPAAMFQTSTPNQRDIQALKTDIQTPLTSSLAAAVYDVMPNDTDVTEFLPLGPDVANYAIGEGVAFYHTPGDNLANMDKRSLFHMGANGLSAVEAFLAAPETVSEEQWLYTDIFGLFIFSMPLLLGIGFVGFGVFGAIFLFIKPGKSYLQGGVIKALLFPPLALILGVGFAVGLTVLIAFVRPENLFASAHPTALRAMQSAAALLGAFIGFKLLSRNVPRLRLAAAAWIWFGVLGGLTAIYLPGGLILFAPPLAIVILASLLGLLGMRSGASVLLALAAVVFFVIILRASAFAEIMLFLEHAAPLTALYVFCFIFLAPLCLSDNIRWRHVGWAPGVCLALGTVVSLVFAVVVPAYSPAAPQPLSITHVADYDNGTSKWVFGKRDPLPSAMNDIASFETDADNPNEISATAPEMSFDGMRVNVTRDRVEGELRQVTVRLDLPESDRVYIGLQGAAEPKLVSMNGLENVDKPQNIICWGRRCRDVEVTLEFKPQDGSASVLVAASYFGLGPESRALVEARPDWALPIQLGDRRVKSKTLTLAAAP